jgi:putative transposase
MQNPPAAKKSRIKGERKAGFSTLSGFMSFYRRHLPHWVPEQATVFVTWRIAGSVAVGADYRARDNESLLQQQERLDSVDRGPAWLRDPRVARVVVEALEYGELVRQFYDLYAWVIMSNHVHLIFQPQVEMAGIMRWLKGGTARQANRILGPTGKAFWRDESFDHWIRTKEELRDLIFYVENNPVKAGLVGSACEWPWSSAEKDRRQKRSSVPLLIYSARVGSPGSSVNPPAYTLRASSS